MQKLFPESKDVSASKEVPDLMRYFQAKNIDPVSALVLMAMTSNTMMKTFVEQGHIKDGDAFTRLFETLVNAMTANLIETQTVSVPNDVPTTATKH